MKSYLSKQASKILTLFENHIDDVNDVTGGSKTSPLFCVWAKGKAKLLTGTSEVVFSRKAIQFRRRIKPIINALGPLFLSCKQVIDRKTEKIPDKPVIYISNHSFKDDAAGTALVAKRNAWFLFGSLPQFYNSFDGISSWLNGVILINRNNKNSKKRAMKLCEDALNLGIDIIIYPEGVWNKTPHKLLLDFWPGFYRIAKATGCPVVPVVHYKNDFYKSDRSGTIHTVVDDPIYIHDLEETEAINMVRDRMATVYWELMECYGKSTRALEIQDYGSVQEKWESALKQLVSPLSRYDFEAETKADYRRKNVFERYQAWSDISNVRNINYSNAHMIVRAQKIYNEMMINDFQRRF